MAAVNALVTDPGATDRSAADERGASLSVVHVLAPALVGGLESVVAALAAGQREAGHDVHVVTLEQQGSAEPQLLATLRDARVPVERIWVRSHRYLDERARFAAMVSRLRPAVVHTHGCRADVIHSVIAHRAGAARVSTIHGITNDRGAKGRVYHWLQHRALRQFEGVVVVSRPLETLFRQRGVAADRLHVVPNAYAAASIPLSRQAARAALGIGDDRILVGWVGRLGWEKGADVVLDALARLPGEFSLSIIGDGPEREPLIALAAKRRIASRVTWHGTVPSAARLMSAFDVYVLSSRTEGTPIALLEAMAAGTPVVATDVGGVPDVISPREGLLVRSGRGDELAYAILAAITDRKASAERVRAATARVTARFDPRTWLAAYESVYGAALSHVRTRTISSIQR